MSKIKLVSLVSSTPNQANTATTALTGNNKENVMPNSTPAAIPVYFRDSSGNWWETCTASTAAENFGPRGCAIRSTPPTDLVRIEDEAEWEVYINADTGNDSNDNECPCMGSNDHCHRCEPPIETCTVCNNDKFVGPKIDSPFVCGGCQDETRYHLGLMKSDKEWEARQEKEFLSELPF